MPASELISAALILTMGVTLQTAVGFGLGLFAMPLLVWSGWPLPAAVALLTGAGFVQTGLGTFAVRAHVRWKGLMPVLLALLLALPLGQVAMGLIVGEGTVFVKQAIGAMLLGMLILRATFQPVPRPSVARGWAFAAGGGAGFLAGLVGMGGPPLVLYSLAHTWSKEQYRAFLWPVFFCASPALAVCIGWQFGWDVCLNYLWGIALFPCVWIGSKLGMGVSARWQMQQLQRGATLLLYGVAVSSLVGPLL